MVSDGGLTNFKYQVKFCLKKRSQVIYESENHLTLWDKALYLCNWDSYAVTLKENEVNLDIWPTWCSYLLHKIVWYFAQEISITLLYVSRNKSNDNIRQLVCWMIIEYLCSSSYFELSPYFRKKLTITVGGT